jgi:SRSO17 transposase
VRGLFQSERGNMLRMSEINDIDNQAMQHMLTTNLEGWNGVTRQLTVETDALLGGVESVAIIDESAMAKKGVASAGVARQWNGRLGKVDNCQVGVYMALSQNGMSNLFDARLYLPKSWLSDAERCERAAIPKAARVYRSKSELALDMVDTATRNGVRYGYLAVDGGYGKEPAFLRGLESRSKCFVADVHKDQNIYLHDPQPFLPKWSGRGRKPTQLKTDVSPIEVQAWAKAQAASNWQILTIREGEKGDIRAEYLHGRVWVWDGVESRARQWHLIVRREPGAETPSHYCLSNAAPDTPLQKLAQVQAQRYFIEHAFHEAKGECGMAEYQVRRWDAWHHHMSLVMLATLFLVKQKKQHRETWPMLSLNDIMTAIVNLLPRRQMTAEELARIIGRRHAKRESAKRSHTKKQNVMNYPPAPGTGSKGCVRV